MRIPAATRFAPLAGLGAGAVSGGVYWLATQLWPSSVAVILSILAGALLTTDLHRLAAATGVEMLSQVFHVLIKYNVLMALSAAKLPFAAPPNAALWLIVICGYGASRALTVLYLRSRSRLKTAPLSHPDLAVALLIGFAPAMLLGLPGLIGVATAVLCVIGLTWHSKSSSEAGLRNATPAPSIAELCFYLGALASWSYV